MASLGQYFNLAVYAAQQATGVASATARFLAMGPKAGQEDCDVRTVAAVALLKSMFSEPERTTVERIQALTNRETPVPKTLWGIRTKFESLDDASGIAAAVDGAIERTRLPEHSLDALPKSHVAPCSGEWQGVRRYKGPIHDLTSQEQYNLLQEGCRDKDTVLLYFHGGAYYLGNETGHREMVSTIAGQFGGKAFSLRYRKAPQAGFPAALTDALAAYEYLVNPPAGALHKPCKPSKIVIAGDSAGGNLAAALMATLIENQPRWALPAGMVLISPWVDLSHSFPSCSMAAENDYLPDMSGRGKQHRASKAWPADGTQAHFYCKNDMITHPLVSSVAYDGWRDAPSVLIQSGAEERLRDEARYLAAHMADEHVAVQYDEYQSMPHVFQMLSPNGPSARESFTRIGEYIRAVTRGEQVTPRRTLRNSKGSVIQFAPDAFEPYDRATLKLAMRTSRDKVVKPVKAVL